MDLLARAARLQDSVPQALEMGTPGSEEQLLDFTKFTPQMFGERFLTQLLEEPIGGFAHWCFNKALEYKKSTGGRCQAFFRICLKRLIYFREVETAPAVIECMGVYVNWTEFTEAPVVDAKSERSKMLPMKNLTELLILEDVLTRKINFLRVY